MMREFLTDIISCRSKLVGRQVEILYYTGVVKELQIKVEVFQKGEVFQILILMENVQKRDDYLRKKFSYKIMKKLFKSFSHEFGTSLNCVMTLAQTAHSNKTINKTVQGIYFEPILKSAKILNSIVNDIRDYNHMLGGTFNLTYTEIDILDLVC